MLNFKWWKIAQSAISLNPFKQHITTTQLEYPAKKGEEEKEQYKGYF